MPNKLELTWYGKDEPILVEPRLLIENAALSNTALAPDTENMLIHEYLRDWQRAHPPRRKENPFSRWRAGFP